MAMQNGGLPLPAVPEGEDERDASRHAVPDDSDASSGPAQHVAQSSSPVSQAQRAQSPAAAAPVPLSPAARLEQGSASEQEALRCKREAARAVREALRQGVLGEVLAGIAGQGLVAEATSVVEHAQRSRQEQAQALYREWSASVYEKIQDRIGVAMAARSTAQMEAELKAASDAYLTATNGQLGWLTASGGHRERGAMPASALYDPLGLQRGIRVATADLEDPVKRELRQADEERRLMQDAAALAASSSGNSSGRMTLPPQKSASHSVRLDPTQFGPLAVAASPHCHCITSTGEYLGRPAGPAALEQHQSHLPLDHFSPPPPPDLHRCGKRVTGAAAAADRSGIVDLLQQREHPGFTGGDAWLEARGKARVEGREGEQGRHGLAEVIQQQGNPYQDGRAWDDAWLQPSGRKKVPGPGQVHGRNNLFALMQWQPLAPDDGSSGDGGVRVSGGAVASARCAVGDRWLDSRGKKRVPGPGGGT